MTSRRGSCASVLTGVAFVLSVSGDACGTFPPPPPSAAISGTFDSSGDAVVGEALIGFLGLPAPGLCIVVGGAATGTRVSTVCGNGVVDPGEDCDVGPAGGSCCTFACHAFAADAACALDDYGCGPGVTPCATCAVGTCDGHGACVAMPRPAGFVCRPRTTACDLDESCDGSSLACPPDQMVPPPDTDGDGLNDGCDPCTDGGQVSKPRLTLKRLTPAGAPNDTMKLKATLSLADPAMLDPVQHGLRLLIDDAQGLRYADITFAPNPPQVGDKGWEATSRGWTFRGNGRITSVRIKRTASSPGELILAMRGRQVLFSSPPETNLPVKATVVLDPPYATTGLCAELVFPGPPGVNLSCTDQRNGSTVSCR